MKSLITSKRETCKAKYGRCVAVLFRLCAPRNSRLMRARDFSGGFWRNIVSRAVQSCRSIIGRPFCYLSRSNPGLSILRTEKFGSRTSELSPLRTSIHLHTVAGTAKHMPSLSRLEFMSPLRQKLIHHPTTPLLVRYR